MVSGGGDEVGEPARTGGRAEPIVTSGVPSPGSWSGARLVETHASVLVFVGDRVYKLRKPVHFGFLDFTSREARQADCQREVDLNRRLAPDVYLGVVDLSWNGQDIDHMVLMRRLPEDKRLATMVRAGADLGAPLRSIARQLAGFHAVALRSPAIDDSATPVRLLRGWQSHFDETEQFLGGLLDPALDDEIRYLSRRYLEGRHELLRERIRSGAVCDGHGDLQAEDVFCLDDGPRILDCLEFDDELRFGDVLADIGFLVMDLERLGGKAYSPLLVDAYREFSGDPIPRSLLAHYCASRAYIRTKVSCLRAAQIGEDRSSGVGKLHRLCRNYLEEARVRLVVVGGLPGSGKSTLAGRLADRLGAVHLSSDEIRKERAGIPTDAAVPAAFGQGLYSADSTREVYRTLLDRAEIFLSRGQSVILDASWSDGGHRALATALAEHTASDPTGFYCAAPEETLASRVVRRRPGEAYGSDATTEVLASMRRRFDPWPEASVVDSTQTVEVCLNGMTTALRA